MNNAELLAYRTKLIRDAANMRKPERVPLVSFFVTWKILDAGYKLSEALTDYSVMEKVVRYHQESYNFDMLNDLGVRNPYRLSLALESPTYMVNDEAESVSVHDIAVCDPKNYKPLVENYQKFMWEQAMPKKFAWWNSEADLGKIQNVLNEMMQFMGFNFKIANIMTTEYAIPPRVAPNPMPQIAMENILGFILGMRGTSIMMRRDKQGLHEIIDTMNAQFFTPQLNMLKQVPEGQNPNFCFDYLHAMLAHNFMNMDQFDEFYWPYLKQILDVIAEKKMNILLFAEGSVLRFKDYLKDYPAGVITLLPEQDDVFEIRKELPNVAIMGGMPNELLGRGTKQQCLDHAKRVLDEIGKDGGLLFSQNKMGSYRNDANPENLKAVCDFVREYVV
ncbi:MAG: hypothetical protein MJ118_03775 [Clostridia bacterium]|nr:hypothetical protein [Clostridia bacterium]